MADKDYVCTLSEASLTVAREQLNEDPRERLGQVETLRKWIMQQKHITVPTDTAFLLKFLRVAKFSQLEARAMLESHLQIKTKFPEILTDVNLSAPECLDILNCGHILPLPKPDPQGRKIVIVRHGLLNLKAVKRDTLIKTMFGVSRYLLLEENTQVNGLVFLQDFSKASQSFITFMGIEGVKKMTSIGQGKYPARFKAIYLYNNNTVSDALLQLMRPFLKQKFRDRMHLLGRTLKNLYKYIPMEYLPEEYLPDDYTGPHQGSLDVIHAAFLSGMRRESHLVQRVQYETSSDWQYDFSVKPDTDDQPKQSFRSLNVD